MRYQFYREHKYVSSALNDLERLIARTDFCDPDSVGDVEQLFDALAGMLEGHAEYENERLHTLLKLKQAPKALYAHVEEEHAAQDQQLQEIQEILQGISQQSSPEKKIEEGYRLYLTYRKFVADSLAHLHEEETQLLPELQRLYSDVELQQVEAQTYQAMTPSDIAAMLEILFPHMNRYDRQALLTDVRALAPDKFPAVLEAIRPSITEDEWMVLAQP
jgi:iron-sulfur cluster repair protein YtfE (RIC family)